MNIEITKMKVTGKSRNLKKPIDIIETSEDKHFDKYYTTHMEEFKPFNIRSQKVINVLEFLNGKPWDDLSLGYVHSLRPSSIRVTKGTIKLDSCIWRVTININDNNIIKSIEQEVELGLPKNVAHGQAMGVALKFGIDSPQCQWYNDEHDGYIISPDGYFKKTKDGLVKFPESNQNIKNEEMREIAPSATNKLENGNWMIDGEEINDCSLFNV